MDSPRAVDPVRSQKTAVTTLRAPSGALASLGGASSGDSGVPQL
jgi:hypothetical protein